MRSLLLDYGPRILLLIAFAYEYFTHGTTYLLGIIALAYLVRILLNGSRKSLDALGHDPKHFSGAIVLWDVIMVGLAIYSFSA